VPFVGRFVDRRGPGPPLRWGLLLTAALVALLPVPRSALGLAALTVLVLGGPMSATMTPVTSVITDLTERAGGALVLATMMLNLGWAAGEVLGAPAAAKLAQMTSDAVPLLALAVLTLISLVVVIVTRMTRVDAVLPGDVAVHGPVTSTCTNAMPGASDLADSIS
jgi:predicted MFS family arabinose efflux permease